MEEEWRYINGSKGYQVSNLGRVKSPRNILDPNPRKDSGYILVHLRMEDGTSPKRLVHRLVAQAFLPNPENKPSVNHINGNPADNKLSNLEWATAGDNNSKKVNERSPINNNCRKVVQLDPTTGELIKIWNSIGEASENYGDVGKCARGISKTSGGYNWMYYDKWIPEDENEIWKEIDETYEVSNKGRVRNIETKLCLGMSKAGAYLVFTNCNRVHREVAKAFIPNPEDLPIVNHKDGEPLNNSLENLEWTDTEGNIRHTIDNNLVTYNYEEIRQYLSDGSWKDWESVKEIAGITPDLIWKACRGNTRAGGYYFKYKKYVLNDDPREPYEFKPPRKLKEKEVIQNLPDGTINNYLDVNDAAKKTGLNVINITKACDRVGGTSEGSIWFYTEDFIVPKMFELKIKKPVEKLKGRAIRQHLSEREFKDFKDNTEAGKVLGINSTHIAQVARRERNFAGGFKFTFVDELI